MTLDIFINQIARYFSFLYYQVGTAGLGLFIVAIAMLILLLLILKRKRKTKGMNILICHNKQQNLQQKTSEQWEKARTHIEKLLYEITEQGVTNESLSRQPAELLADNEQHYCEIVKQKRVDKMRRDRAVESRRLKRSSSLLDVHELQAVATLAKQLRARGRHRVRS